VSFDGAETSADALAEAPPALDLPRQATTPAARSVAITKAAPTRTITLTLQCIAHALADVPGSGA
jgi:hypothetical protein